MTRIAVLLGLVIPNPLRADEKVSFADRVAPLLTLKCLGCHSGPKPKGELDLTKKQNLADVVKPGKSGDSSLYQNVFEAKMPPKKPLSPEEVATLKRWIDEGATWDGGDLRPPKQEANRKGSDWWSLQPIRSPTLPTVKNSSRVRNPIDLFVLAKQEQLGLQRSPEIDRRAFIRRVTLDLTGLLPTPDEVRDYENDPSPRADEKLVDRLLASPAYGETWARHWLDLVRFAESSGYETNTLRPNAWYYRDYVIRALNRDEPFKEFVRRQLAGDSDPKADAVDLGATGFLVAGPHDMVGDAIPEAELQKRSNDLFDMVSTTSQAFLGLTVGCARCHDHKFDPISQRDFYAMEAVFAGVDHFETPLPNSAGPNVEKVEELRRRIASLERELDEAEPLASPNKEAPPRRSPVRSLRNIERFALTPVKFVRFTTFATNNGIEPCIDEIELFTDRPEDGDVALASRGVKATASSEYPNASIHKIAHINDGLYGNSFSWISREPGKGWIQLELPHEFRVQKLVWARDREGKFADRTPIDYVVEGSLDGKEWTVLCGSWDRAKAGQNAPVIDERLTRARSELAELLKPAMIYRGSFRVPDKTVLLKRGDVTQHGPEVTPRGLEVVPVAMRSPEGQERDRRLALAEWIASPENPLPARVMVNRLWHHHFGAGLVRTPSDFGVNGDRPSNPELLDFLASEFLRDGSLKWIHRLIVLSSTYRQSSRIDPVNSGIDADNRYLWRFTSRRLEAEKIRDCVLQVSGALNRKAGGPGYHLWDYSNYVTVFTPKPKLGPEEFRRMVYQFKPRVQQDRTFGVFDCPDATAIMPKRTISTTPLQALNLFNDEFVFDQAERFAARVKSEVGNEVTKQIDRAFELALLRLPTESQRTGAVSLVSQHGLASLCRVLFNCNEFVVTE